MILLQIFSTSRVDYKLPAILQKTGFFLWYVLEER